jgi:DNA-binding response OmpR family regulator
MIRLIITADDELYDRLAHRAQAEGDTLRRADNALDGLEQAITESPGLIIVDMALRSADTLLEALHSRRETTSIPLLAVTADGWLPFELHRLCAAVLKVEML